MRLDLRLFGLALLLPVAAAQASAQTDYAYAFALDTKTPSEAYRVALTPEVYAAINRNANLQDIVVVNSDGQPVPFGPMPVEPPQTRDFTAHTRMLPVPVSRDAAGTVRVERNTNGDIVINQGAATGSAKPTQWLIDAGSSASVERIELDPASVTQDLQLHVEVDASDDLKNWSQRGDTGSLTRVSGQGDDGGVEQLSLDVGGTPARYYRIRLIDGDVDWSNGHTPNVTLQGSYVPTPADTLATLSWQRALEDTRQNGTDFDYRLIAALPLQAAKLALPSSNVAAHVTLLAGQDDNGKMQWTPLGSADIVRVGTGAAEATLRWTSQPIQHLRVHVDTALAAPPTLVVGWEPDQFMFMAEGHAPYRLLAGSYAARRGDYPMTASLEKLRDVKPSDWLPPEAGLGARADAGGPNALLAPKLPYDWTRPVLWLVLILGALLIAGMAWSLLKQSRGDQPAPKP
ncbi:DUF3999 family protein [Dyella sp. GSA-30]|uniref:DUF3999 family protein n=1 Tax=Dyella sp. GSA-30 TaxID=2994496 RepID=UPI0024921B0F|nr:DUF3999 family protein [Dyella sp. GSA-30]BDU22268.1 hypothetical protein DYGSA30_37250 [Dyella sp. GSA-30]